MRKEEINWRAYRKKMAASLSNKRNSLQKCISEEKIHLYNIADLKEDISAIDHGNFNMIIEKYKDHPEQFEDCFLPEPDDFPTDGNALYNEMLLVAPYSLIPYSNSEEQFQKLAQNVVKSTYFRVCNKYQHEVEWEMTEKNKSSLFSSIRKEFTKEIYDRIKNNPLNRYDSERMKTMEAETLFYLVFDDEINPKEILQQFEALGLVPLDESNCGWLDEEYIKEYSQGKLLVFNQEYLVEIDEYDHREQLEGEYGITDAGTLSTYKLCDVLRYKLGENQ